MTVQGNLSEMGVADLIQHACLDGRTTRITLQREGESSAYCVYIENGKLVHAENGDQVGEEVIFDVLGWQEGTFALEADVPPPSRSIDRSYAGVLLEGMQRLDEGRPNDSTPVKASREAEPVAQPGLEGLVGDLKQIQGVAGVILAARDGVVIAHALEDNPDKNAAMAVFVGLAAGQVGEALSLGAFEWATVVSGKEMTLVIERPDYFIGLLLTSQASPALVASQARKLLA